MTALFQSLIRLVTVAWILPASLTYYLLLPDHRRRVWIRVVTSSEVPVGWYASTDRGISYQAFPLIPDLVQIAGLQRDDSSVKLLPTTAHDGGWMMRINDSSASEVELHHTVVLQQPSTQQQPTTINDWSRHGFRRNTNRHTVVSQPLPVITYLVAMLNMGLFGLYRWKHIEPNAVALSEQLVGAKPWQCVTGPLAHFEVWHLAFNMMAWMGLGTELEQHVWTSSLEFGLWNLSLLPLTCLLWYAFERLVQYFRNGTIHPTVGFSGILFVWMVVASLEQSQTCPIIFLPDLCFVTHRILGDYKWSWGPWVQLLVAQVLLPRVSWTGHAAGIVCGFALHAIIRSNWRWIFQPALLFPVLLLIRLGRPPITRFANKRLVQMQALMLGLAFLVMGVWHSVVWVAAMVLVATLHLSTTIEAWVARHSMVILVMAILHSSMMAASWIYVGTMSVVAWMVLMVMTAMWMLTLCLASVTLDASHEVGIFRHTLVATLFPPVQVIGRAWNDRVRGSGGQRLRVAADTKRELEALQPAEDGEDERVIEMV